MTVKGIGKGALRFDESWRPYVSVYPFTQEMLSSGPPAEWTDVLIGLHVFAHEVGLDAGEIITETLFVPLGPRRADLVAYRVEFGAGAEDTRTKKGRAWRAATMVGVTLQADRWHNGIGGG
ncbi:MAG: hypothetical protein M3N98_03180 [Actinomycetota bacterium]|nr:hypothetical protein [Actinomycetota bacterium]